MLEVELSAAAVLDDRSAGAVVIDDERAVLVGVLLGAVHDVVVDVGGGRRAGPAVEERDVRTRWSQPMERQGNIDH